MYLYITITTRDDKTKKYQCVDFPSNGNGFIVLYLKNFERIHIPQETILRIHQSFTK